MHVWRAWFIHAGMRMRFNADAVRRAVKNLTPTVKNPSLY
jgi:hypothetical protein